jgi:predicted Zn-dependent protease
MKNSRHLCRISLALLLGASFVSLPPLHAAAKNKEEVPRGATEREIQIGKKSAEELEKNPKIKLLDGKKDPVAKALLDKLNRMVTEIGKVSARPDIKYSVKIVDDDDLNAFTLPNGQIYLFRGLLDFAGSDDEIAAVLSHEIGHNARLHALRGQAKAKKLSWISLAAMAAMLTGKGGADVAQFSQYLLMGIMNGYSEEYEKEADVAAIEQLAKTNYNPSSLVTFMQRLNQEERRRPEWEPGIFRTHPPTDSRAAAAIADIKQRGLPFNPREVTGAPQAVVEASENKDRVALKYGKQTIAEFAASEKTLENTRTQANAAAARINDLMRANLKMHEITADGDNRGARLLARGTEVLRITPADAGLQKLTPLAYAEKTRDAFRRLFWRETLTGKM